MQNVLVVDDELALGKLYEKELRDEGYNVLLANNANEALRITRDQNIDLVVLDIKMEGKDGLEVLNEFRQNNSDTPVILNSAYSIYKDDFSSWLADAYIVKSSNLDELKNKIRELIKF
ncbi:MAG: response regulator [candidate division Zixibacteria bacterium]|nr:response regulator [candidate division Zixibacteria bacterium]